MARGDAFCPEPERPRQQVRDLVHRAAAGELPRTCSSHPVAHRKHEVRSVHLGLTDLPQVPEPARVKRKRKKSIFIVLPHMPAMRHAGPAKPGWIATHQSL